ncbi:MAG: hypothetical protein LIR50_17340 [Bacillota bacterium]|nr:hypothetical protein [Bacillota bacterium]
MKHIYKLFISVYLILLIFVLTSFSCFKGDPISEIFKVCGSTPESCGIKLVINKKNIDTASILKSFGIKRDTGFSIDYSENYISFKAKKARGYLEQIPEEEAYILYFESEDKNDSPMVLRDRILGQVSGFHDYNYYVFQKGSVSNQDFRWKVLDEIKTLKGDNISYQNIENGWNAVFKINNSPYKGFIKDNGKLINYQCALMKYKSGDYLIVGSPIITITY